MKPLKNIITKKEINRNGRSTVFVLQPSGLVALYENIPWVAGVSRRDNASGALRNKVLNEPDLAWEQRGRESEEGS